MKRKVAEKIVEAFFNDMNPNFWNGKGKFPNTFDSHSWQYPLTDEVSLEITLGYDDVDGWKHFCDLVYSSNDESFDIEMVLHKTTHERYDPIPIEIR